MSAAQPGGVPNPSSLRRTSLQASLTASAAMLASVPAVNPGKANPNSASPPLLAAERSRLNSLSSTPSSPSEGGDPTDTDAVVRVGRDSLACLLNEANLAIINRDADTAGLREGTAFLAADGVDRESDLSAMFQGYLEVRGTSKRFYSWHARFIVFDSFARRLTIYKNADLVKQYGTYVVIDCNIPLHATKRRFFHRQLRLDLALTDGRRAPLSINMYTREAQMAWLRLFKREHMDVTVDTSTLNINFPSTPNAPATPAPTPTPSREQVTELSSIQQQISQISNTPLKHPDLRPPPANLPQTNLAPLSPDSTKALFSAADSGVAHMIASRNTRSLDVFISSSSHDFIIERLLLNSAVFPTLRQYGKSLGIQVNLPTDLSEAPNHFKNTHAIESIRNKEITRCKKSSVGHSYVQLLGDRYGPNVLPSKIPAVAFEKIMEVMENEDHIEQVVLLTKWYHLDENATPFAYKLQPINSFIPDFLCPDPSRHAIAEQEWLDTVALLEESLSMASHGHMDNNWRETYQTSELHSEMKQGVGGKSKSKPLAFIREAVAHDFGDPLYMNYRDVKVTQHGEHVSYCCDEVRRERLEALKRVLGESDATLTTSSIPSAKALCDGHASAYLTNFLDSFCASMIECLRQAALLNRVLPTPLEADVAAHIHVGRMRQSNFTDNSVTKAKVGKCLEYLDDDNLTSPFYIYGPSGSGKTSVLSKVLEQITDAKKESTHVLIRFVGTGHSTSSGLELLSSLCEQMMCVLASIAEDEGSGKRSGESELPHTFTDMCHKFSKTLKSLADKAENVIILLDGVDGLSTPSGGDANLLFSWLPAILPPRTKVFVSGDSDSSYHQVLSGICATGVKLDLWGGDDVGKFLGEGLDKRGRKITMEQMAYVRRSLGDFCSPLVAQLTLHEAASWPSYMEGLDKIPLMPNAAYLIDRMLDKLERKHGEVIIRAIFGYVQCAKEGGLSTNEILDVLSLDDQLLKMIETLLPDGYLSVNRRFPVVLLTRILQECVDILELRSTADGSQVWGFAHKMIEEAVRKRCEKMKPHLHRGLGEYFGGIWAEGKKVEGKGQPIQRYVDPQTLLDIGGKPNLRKIMELPYHLIKCKEWELLASFLSNLNVLDVLGHRGSRRSYLRPGTARSMLLELWRTYELKGKGGGMVARYKKSLEDWQKKVSPSVRDSNRRMKGCAVFLKDAGVEFESKKYVKAAGEMFEQLLRREELEFGAEHPATVSTFRMLQSCLKSLGEAKLEERGGGWGEGERGEEGAVAASTLVKGRPARLGSWKLDDMDVPLEMLKAGVQTPEEKSLTPVALRDKIENDSPTPISPIPVHSPLRETVNEAKERGRADMTPHTGLDSWIATKGGGWGEGKGGENLVNYFEAGVDAEGEGSSSSGSSSSESGSYSEEEEEGGSGGGLMKSIETVDLQ